MFCCYEGDLVVFSYKFCRDFVSFPIVFPQNRSDYNLYYILTPLLRDGHICPGTRIIIIRAVVTINR